MGQDPAGLRRQLLKIEVAVIVPLLISNDPFETVIAIVYLQNVVARARWPTHDGDRPEGVDFAGVWVTCACQYHQVAVPKQAHRSRSFRQSLMGHAPPTG